MRPGGGPLAADGLADVDALVVITTACLDASLAASLVTCVIKEASASGGRLAATCAVATGTRMDLAGVVPLTDADDEEERCWVVAGAVSRYEVRIKLCDDIISFLFF